MDNPVYPFKRYPYACVVRPVFGVFRLLFLPGFFLIIGFGGGYGVFLVRGKRRQLLLKQRRPYFVFSARFDFFDPRFYLVQAGKDQFYRFVIKPNPLFL